MTERDARSWKYAFDPDFVEEGTERKRKELTPKQKEWVYRAWEWASTALLGMEKPCTPNAIPVYQEERGFFYQEAHRPELHHVTPVGVANRILGEEYNYPENIVPIDAPNHTGKGVDPTMEDYFIVHQDTFEATQAYREGFVGESPYTLMGQERRRRTAQGKLYHDDSYDEHLRELAQRVVDGYREARPEDTWPEKKKRRVK